MQDRDMQSMFNGAMKVGLMATALCAGSIALMVNFTMPPLMLTVALFSGFTALSAFLTLALTDDNLNADDEDYNGMGFSAQPVRFKQPSLR